MLVASWKDNYYYKFVFGEDGKYKAFVCKYEGLQPTLDVDKTFTVLVDPKEKEVNDIDFVDGVLILIASTNKKHYYNWSKVGLIRFFMIMSTSEELRDSKKFFCKQRISDDLINLRFRVVGGAPRYIFNEKEFQDRKNAMVLGSSGLDFQKINAVLQGASPRHVVEDKDFHLPTLFLKYEITKGRNRRGNRYTDDSVSIEGVSHFAKVSKIKYRVVVQGQNISDPGP